MSPLPDYDLGTARGRIELDASSLGRAEAALKGLGLGLIGVGGAAVAGFAYAVKSAADFEKIMSAVGAVTNASGADMDRLKQQALDLGASTVYSADEIGRAMEQLGKAGITVEDMLGGATEAVINLAAAAGDELAGGIDQAAVVIANAMKTFGAGADELDHFADVIVGAAISSTLSVDDMATSMTYAGPIASALGLSIDDLSTALAVLGDRGIRGSTAGTSLRGILISLTPSSKKAADAMRDLGIMTADGTNRFYDMNGSLKPLPQVMQILSDATKDLSQQEKVAAFNAIFQRRAMNAAMILAEQGAEGFEDYADAIANIDASDVAEKKLDNLAGDFTLLKNSVDSLLIKVGLPLQNMVRGWVQGLTDLVNKLHDVNPEIVALVLQIAAIGGVVLIAAGGFIFFLGMLVRLHRNLVLIREAFLLLRAAMALKVAALLTNPITIAIAILVALGAALYLAYKRSEEFRARVDAAMKALEPVFRAVGGFISNFVDHFKRLVNTIMSGEGTVAGVAQIIDDMFGGTGKLVGPIMTLVDVFKQVWATSKQAFDYFANVILPILWDFSIAVGQVIGEVVHWFIDEGLPAIIDFATAVIDQVGKAVSWLDENVAPVFTEVAALIVAVVERIIQVIEFLWPVFEHAWDIIVTVIQTAWRIIETILDTLIITWQNFGDDIINIVEFAWGFIKSVIEGALQFIKGLIQIVTGVISGDWSKVWQGIKNVLGAVWASIKLIPKAALEAIKIGIQAFFSLLQVIWKAGWNILKTALSLVWDLIVSAITGSLEMIKGLIENALELVKTIWSAAWDAIWTALTTVWTTISEFFTSLPGVFAGFFSDAINWLYDAGKDILEGLRGGIKIIYESVKTWFEDLPGKIKDFFAGAIDWLYQAGKDIIQGIIDGIADAPSVVDAIARKVPGLGKGIPFKDAPGVGRLIPGAKGGIFTRPTGMLIGEAGPEVLLPLNDMRRTIGLMHKSGLMSKLGGVGGTTLMAAVDNRSSSIVNRPVSTVNVKFDLSGARFGEGSAESVQAALTSEQVLRQLTRAVATGTGRQI